MTLLISSILKLYLNGFLDLFLHLIFQLLLSISSTHFLRFDVPQGSILGSCLFSLCPVSLRGLFFSVASVTTSPNLFPNIPNFKCYWLMISSRYPKRYLKTQHVPNWTHLFFPGSVAVPSPALSVLVISPLFLITPDRKLECLDIFYILSLKSANSTPLTFSFLSF